MEALVSPKSIALIGVSADPDKISGRLLPILRAYGYGGRIYPVNPHREEILGYPCYPNVESLPETPDVAVVLVPNTAVPAVLQGVVSKKVPYAMVYSSGFNEAGEEGEILAESVRHIIYGSHTRLIGPNTEGLVDLAFRTPLSFSPVIDPERGRKPLRRGQLVVLSQSGGLGFGIADQADAAGFGIRAVVTTGNELDLDVTDFIEYYGYQADVDTIVLLIEGLKRPERFVQACRSVRHAGKRVLAIRIGQSPSGRLGVSRHTAKHPVAEIEDRAFAEAGVVTVSDVEELLCRLEVHRKLPRPNGRRVAVVTTSGGGGIWGADWLHRFGLAVPRLSESLEASLRGLLPKFASLVNPVDVTAQAIFDGTAAQCIDRVMASDEFDALFLVATLGYDHKLITDAVFQRALRERKKPVVVFSYTPPSEFARNWLDSAGIFWSTSPIRCARALALALQPE